MEKFIIDAIDELKYNIKVAQEDIKILEDFENKTLIEKLETAKRTEIIYKRNYMEKSLFKHFKNPYIRENGTLKIEINFITIYIEHLEINIPLHLSKDIIIKDNRFNIFENDFSNSILKSLYDIDIIENKIKETIIKQNNIKPNLYYFKNKKYYKEKVFKLEKQLSKYKEENIRISQKNKNIYSKLNNYMKEDQEIIEKINEDLLYFKNNGYTIKDKTYIYPKLEKYLKNKNLYFIQDYKEL